VDIRSIVYYQTAGTTTWRNAFSASSYPKDKGLPNTLCHIALQGWPHRALCSSRNLLWVIIGCIIPDIPWVFLRISLALDLADPYVLRLYTTVQASLFFCILAAVFLALFTVRPTWTFGILSGNCILHLLLDAMQVKYANGVHLTAPLDWTVLHFNLFRMEHPLGLPLTAAGLFLLVRYWPEVRRQQHWSSIIRPVRVLAAACLLLYLTGPLPFLDDLRQTDFHFLQTLQDTSTRTGKYVEFDRVAFDRRRQTIRIFSGEQIRLTGEMPVRSGTISVRGRFIAPDTVQAIGSQQHGKSRDLASIAGIFLACLLTAQTVILSRFPPSIPTKDRDHA
jgi:hypothetical protein